MTSARSRLKPNLTTLVVAVVCLLIGILLAHAWRSGDTVGAEPSTLVPQGIASLEDAFVQIAETAEPSVVTVQTETTRIVTSRDPFEFFRSPLEDDPFFRRFFGEPRSEEPSEGQREYRSYGGGSGVGTAAIQLVKAAGGTAVVTAGAEEKCRRCCELGADVAVNYRDAEADWVAQAKRITAGEGVDVVLDSIGAPYLERNLAALKPGGRLVLIGLMGGAKGEIGLGPLLIRRLQLIGSTLRARPAEEKAPIVEYFQQRFGAALERGEIGPVVDRVLPLEQAKTTVEDALEDMAARGCTRASISARPIPLT